METDRRASGFQIFCIALLSSSAGLYMYSSVYDPNTGTSWLIALAVAGGVALSVGYIISMLYRLCGSGNAQQLLADILGRPLSRVIMLFAALYFAARAAQTVSLQCSMISTYLLGKTPDSVINLAVLLCGCAVFEGGMMKLLRTAELTALLMTVPLIILIAAGMTRIDPEELRPLLSPDFGYVPEILPGAVMTVSGAECTLFLLGRDKAKTDPLRPLSLAAAAITVISAVMYLLAAGTLTADGIGSFSFPLEETSRIINIGGVALTERFDTILIVLRIFALLLQTAILNYSASSALAGTFGLSSHRCFTFILLPLELLVSSLARGSFGIILNVLCFYGFVIFCMMILPLLLVIAVIRSGGAKKAVAHEI